MLDVQLVARRVHAASQVDHATRIRCEHRAHSGVVQRGELALENPRRQLRVPQRGHPAEATTGVRLGQRPHLDLTQIRHQILELCTGPEEIGALAEAMHHNRRGVALSQRPGG